MGKFFIEIKETRQVEVKYLFARCGVRYWEDGEVNGVEDTEGALIPLRKDDEWIPTIDLHTGVILNWPVGTVADVHYKVCDAGIYYLLDEDKTIVKTIDGYVPEMMCPEGDGYGDYVIMKIDAEGKIANWKVVLSEFEDDDD